MVVTGQKEKPVNKSSFDHCPTETSPRHREWRDEFRFIKLLLKTIAYIPVHLSWDFGPAENTTRKHDSCKLMTRRIRTRRQVIGSL